MGFSRDEHPWVGQVPDKSGLYISAGYTGHGAYIDGIEPLHVLENFTDLFTHCF